MVATILNKKATVLLNNDTVKINDHVIYYGKRSTAKIIEVVVNNLLEAYKERGLSPVYIDAETTVKIAKACNCIKNDTTNPIEDISTSVAQIIMELLPKEEIPLMFNKNRYIDKAAKRILIGVPLKF